MGPSKLTAKQMCLRKQLQAIVPTCHKILKLCPFAPLLICLIVPMTIAVRLHIIEESVAESKVRSSRLTRYLRPSRIWVHKSDRRYLACPCCSRAVQTPKLDKGTTIDVSVSRGSRRRLCTLSGRWEGLRNRSSCGSYEPVVSIRLQLLCIMIMLCTQPSFRSLFHPSMSW
jgi:hypothetical protein